MFKITKRALTTIAPLKPNYTAGEKMIHEKLANSLEASKLNVSDISGIW
jgi:BolA-like protein 3